MSYHLGLGDDAKKAQLATAKLVAQCKAANGKLPGCANIPWQQSGSGGSSDSSDDTIFGIPTMGVIVVGGLTGAAILAKTLPKLLGR